jgi:hypothetical protein
MQRKNAFTFAKSIDELHPDMQPNERIHGAITFIIAEFGAAHTERIASGQGTMGQYNTGVERLIDVFTSRLQASKKFMSEAIRLAQTEDEDEDADQL